MLHKYYSVEGQPARLLHHNFLLYWKRKIKMDFLSFFIHMDILFKRVPWDCWLDRAVNPMLLIRGHLQRSDRYQKRGNWHWLLFTHDYVRAFQKTDQALHIKLCKSQDGSEIMPHLSFFFSFLLRMFNQVLSLCLELNCRGFSMQIKRGMRTWSVFNHPAEKTNWCIISAFFLLRCNDVLMYEFIYIWY